MIRETALLLATTAGSQLLCQQLTEGYDEAAVTLPAGAGNVLETAFGTVYFDGLDVVLDPGTGGSSLLTFPSFTFGSFTAPIGATKVLFGESSNGGLWTVPLNGLAAQLVANVPFNYDAVLLDDNHALVSAKTGGFSAPDNDVMFVDLQTGQTQLVAQFAGASGPLAIDDAGDIYYATAPATFPAPAGTVDVFRLTRAVVDAAIAGGQVLGPADATVVISGLDAAGDLAFDDDGDLIFVDWFNGRIGEINDADGANASLAPAMIDYAGSGLSGSALQFVPAAAAGGQDFEPFQPVGATLRVHETDYVTINQIRSVAGAQPQLTVSTTSPVPAGPFTLDTAGGPANGIGLVVFAPASPAGPVTLSLQGFEQPLLLDGALVGSQVIFPVAFDAAGSASLPASNPGFTQPFGAIAQTVAVSTTGVLAASATLALQIAN